MVTNLGPRPKQIRPLTNDRVVVTDGRVLGIGSGKPDWLDITPDDIFDPTRADGRVVIGDGLGPFSSYEVSDTSGSQIFYVPFSGDQISLWNGTRWVNHTILPWDEGGPTFFTDDLARDGLELEPAENYDIYIYDDAGDLEIELVRWSVHGAGGSTRDPSNTLATRNGILVLSSDHTRRYVGTIRIYPTFVLFINSHQYRLVWNMYNRVLTASMDNPSMSAQLVTEIVTPIPWGSAGSPNSNYPTQMVFGLPTAVRANYTIIPRCFTQTGVVVTSDIWRCHATIYLNTAVGATLSAGNQTVGVTSITRQGLAQPSTQKTATMWLPSVFAATLSAGYHFLQPMWAAEEIITCSGCATFDIGTLVAGAHSTVEFEN